MDNFNKFFKKLYSSPSMLWKAGVGVILLCLSIAVAFMPTVSLGLIGNYRFAFSATALLYAFIRFYTCYAEYKSYRDE